MKILNLRAENLKRLSVVEIEPDGNLVQITGKNGQGKTSVLDAIWWALDGSKNIQAKPIRDGEERAMIQLDMGEIKVTRRFNAQDDGGYTTSITVENGDGARFSSPQTMLDNMLGELTFDPLSFMRMKDRDQVMAMRSLVPDFDFEAAESKIKSAFETRTTRNRQAKEAEAAAEKLSEMLPDEIPERMSISDISDEWDQAKKHNDQVERDDQKRENLMGEEKELALEIERLTKKHLQIKSDLDQMDRPSALIDTAPIREKLESVEKINRVIDAADNRNELTKQAEEAKEQSALLTEEIDKIKATAEQAISSAPIPVDGLSISNGEVQLDGVPFSQASDAQQLQASIGIAMALNPSLKVIRVRDGSLLDDDAMKILADMADSADYQIWIERVDNSGEVGFVLQDGHLKGHPPQSDEEQPQTPQENQGESLFDNDKV